MNRKEDALVILEQQQQLRDFPNSMVLKALIEKETKKPKALLKQINKALVLAPTFAEDLLGKRTAIRKNRKNSRLQKKCYGRRLKNYP